MYCAADAVIDVEWISVGCKTGSGAVQLNHKTLGRLTLEPQCTVGVMIGNGNRLGHKVYDVGVVPDTLGGQCARTNDQSVDVVMDQAVTAEERTLVSKFLFVQIDAISRSSGIVNQYVVERVHINANSRAKWIVANDVVDDGRLRSTNKDRRWTVVATSKARLQAIVISVNRVETTGTQLDNAVGNSSVRAMNLDWVECAEPAFQTSFTTGVSNDRVIEAESGKVTSINTGPITSTGLNRCTLVVGVKVAASTVANVAQGSEDDLVTIFAFGEQIRTHHQLDNCVLALDDRSRINSKSSIGPSPQALIRFIQFTASDRSIIDERRAGTVDLGNQYVRANTTRRAAIEATGNEALEIQGGGQVIDNHLPNIQLVEGIRVAGNGDRHRRIGSRCFGVRFVNECDAIVVGSRLQNSADRTRLRIDQLGWRCKRIEDRAAGLSVNDQILLQDVNDVGIVEPTRHVQSFQLVASQGVDADEHTVDRVVDQAVSINVRSAATVIRGKRTTKLVVVLVERRFQE